MRPGTAIAPSATPRARAASNEVKNRPMMESGTRRWSRVYPVTSTTELAIPTTASSAKATPVCDTSASSANGSPQSAMPAPR